MSADSRTPPEFVDLPELSDLVDEGVDFVQFDEPVLTEIVHGGGSERRTFM